MATLVQLTSSRGVDLMLDDRHRVASVAGWDSGAELSTERVERLRGGTFRDASRWKGKAITLSGRTQGEPGDWVHAEARRVASLLHDLEPAALVFDCGLMLSCEVQADGQPLVNALHGVGRVEWQIPLWSADGRLYGQSKRVLIQPSGTGVGLRWPLFGGGQLDWGMSTSERAALVNAGTADAWPVFEVWTDSGAGFRLKVGGKALTYAGPCVSSTPVVVDARGTVTVGGADHTSRLVERDWPTVPAGSSLTATFETLDRSPGHCWATIRDTYL